MLWNVSRLLKSPAGSEREYALNDEGRGIAELASGITGNVRMIRTDRAILVIAQVHTAVRCVCSRCLDDYSQVVDFEIAEEFFPLVDINTGASLACPEDGFTIDPFQTLDLTEPVRQYALLNVPMKPLCSPDCPGLCANCGAQLKVGPCGCSTPKADPRWNKLAGLHLGLIAN